MVYHRHHFERCTEYSADGKIIYQGRWKRINRTLDTGIIMKRLQGYPRDRRDGLKCPTFLFIRPAKQGWIQWELAKPEMMAGERKCLAS